MITTTARPAAMAKGMAARWEVIRARTKNENEKASRRNRMNTAPAARSAVAPLSSRALKMAISIGLVGTKNWSVCRARRTSAIAHNNTAGVP
ncbi:MAG: hypothetical protein AB7I13_10805, partial [Vicinamibacterales bacterium]